MEEKKEAKIAAQVKCGKGKNKKARNVLQCMKFNKNAKEEKKTKDTKRAKRLTEMYAVQKRARPRLRKQWNVDMKIADL